MYTVNGNDGEYRISLSVMPPRIDLYKHNGEHEIYRSVEEIVDSADRKLVRERMQTFEDGDDDDDINPFI